jgi:hypothetical protein
VLAAAQRARAAGGDLALKRAVNCLALQIQHIVTPGLLSSPLWPQERAGTPQHAVILALALGSGLRGRSC